ncbi:MAG: ABC transporter ATP-binding protein [Symploca sp. SIO3C6]|uniref:ABC transporter ATP-binding protein n=1 Tax=Symploca sp. SIO1C4 TaxID=2607765 RepID=A0A6B3N8R0_9CYAN|nr:ABC transporter ATP-binding protein [Symploca sp. SIO3C6]NER26504.1 ABC transporter ATP-binding protein [Symploca sp. SIO1C4]
MSELAISLKSVSKCFKRYARPADRLKDLLLPGKSRADEFWALQNINLEVPKGQTLGIVGRNGSGKSTLLQILVGTLTPTTGEVKVKGRVSALLELGSGFNPEFTGRQNVFFNGRLLGLSQQDIEAKFDQIAAFADIGDFIDQPVKTYSSGMFVRLAFAVATSVEPDILVVDEALAVGDEVFQRKCFARIQSIQERGGTILFVSHSASSVIELCNRAVLIDSGELLLSGSPKSVISKYHKLAYAPADKLEVLRQEMRYFNCQESKHNLEKIYFLQENELKHRQTKKYKTESSYDSGLIPKSTISYVARGTKIEGCYITNSEEKVVNVLCRNTEYVYHYSVRFDEAAYKVRFGMLLKTINGLELGGAASHPVTHGIEYIEPGSVVQVKFKFNCYLLPGVYFLNAGVLGYIDHAEVYLHRCIDAAMFRVQMEEDILSTAIVDFQIEPKVLISQQQVSA